MPNIWVKGHFLSQVIKVRTYRHTQRTDSFTWTTTVVVKLILYCTVWFWSH